MNNRLAMGLAVGAGYLLGRTKKAKLAFGIGTMVIGKKLQLSPRALAEFASSQLQNNPQFKEIGDQLREDMRGVGKAATGALVTRQLNAVADRLHDRTLGVQDQLSGAVPDDVSDQLDDDQDKGDDERDDERRERRRETASAAKKTGTGTTKKAPAKRTASAAKKTAAKKTTSAAKGGRSRG